MEQSETFHFSSLSGNHNFEQWVLFSKAQPPTLGLNLAIVGVYLGKASEDVRVKRKKKSSGQTGEKLKGREKMKAKVEREREKEEHPAKRKCILWLGIHASPEKSEPLPCVIQSL